MVVDDEKDILSVITRSLENGGIKVHGFDNPVAALEHIGDGCHDCWLLLSDVRMPQMTGFELVKKAKHLRPELVILLMSSYEINKQEFDKVLPSTKVEGFILKPAKMSQLVEAIKQHETMRQTTQSSLSLKNKQDKHIVKGFF
jgi:DNA-binding NtrC family response regulator